MRKFYQKKIRSEVKLTLKTVLLGGHWLKNPVKLKKLLRHQLFTLKTVILGGHCVKNPVKLKKIS